MTNIDIKPAATKTSAITNLLLCWLLCFQSIAFAAKPPLVLVPVQGPGLSADDKENYRIALQESLSLDYTVFSGGVVETKLQKSVSKNCDVTQCLQEVAIAFQGELIGRLVVTPQGNGYMLAVEIKNIFDDKVIVSKNLPCEGCNNFAVIRKLKELDLAVVSDRVTEPEKKEKNGIAWYWWALGVVAVGAAAAGGGGGDEPPPAQTGTVNVTW